MRFPNVTFGAGVGPTCLTCRVVTHVIRRTPHPVYGSKYELQTFQCQTCRDEIERSADCDGLPLPVNWSSTDAALT